MDICVEKRNLIVCSGTFVMGFDVQCDIIQFISQPNTNLLTQVNRKMLEHVLKTCSCSTHFTC